MVVDCATSTPAKPCNPLADNLRKREIPSLNGLRGVAALAVVVWHYLDAWHLSYLYPGPFAVTLFFELSGLLITWLLLTEIETTGTISRSQFYLRRALRLFPVFYIVWLLCRWAGPFPGSWAYLFYLGDYYTAIQQNYSVMTQAWSLGVEEKFYFVWPLILMCVRGRKLVWLCVAVLVVQPIYRLCLSTSGHETYTWFAFDCRLDPIVLGCLIALLVKRGWIAPKWLAHPLTPAVALALILVFQRFSVLVTYLLAVVLMAVISRPGRFLNNTISRYLGAISYSLYLVHPLARDVGWPRMASWVPTNSIGVALGCQVVLAIGMATLLHFAVELPFLRLKNHLHGRFVPHAS